MKASKDLLPNGFRKNEKGEIWFSESGVLWPGQKMSLRVKKMLFEGKREGGCIRGMGSWTVFKKQAALLP